MYATDGERKKWVAALLRERAGYEQAGQEERVKAVDEQLALYGYKKPVSVEAVKRTPPEGRTTRQEQQRKADR